MENPYLPAPKSRAAGHTFAVHTMYDAAGVDSRCREMSDRVVMIEEWEVESESRAITVA